MVRHLNRTNGVIVGWYHYSNTTINLLDGVSTLIGLLILWLYCYITISPVALLNRTISLVVEWCLFSNRTTSLLDGGSTLIVLLVWWMVALF